MIVSYSKVILELHFVDFKESQEGVYELKELQVLNLDTVLHWLTRAVNRNDLRVYLAKLVDVRNAHDFLSETQAFKELKKFVSIDYPAIVQYYLDSI